MKNFQWPIIARVFVMFAVLCAAALLLVNRSFYFVFSLPVLAYLVVDFYRFHRKAHNELNQFVESIHYRDFSRNFDVKHAPGDLKPLRKGFNEINSTFK